jgi:8-oxo-dGTP diphosphatase
MKTVAYWTARAIGSDDISRYRANDEIDRVEWVDWEKAADRLTYEHDRETLSQAHGLRKKTRALVVLRHGKARSRKAWKDDDRRRPLLDLGNTQAQRIVPVLAAFDVQAVHTSSSTRCVETVLPYSHTTGWPLTTYDSLSEEGADPEAIRSLVASLLESRQGAVLCSHRPVLPEILGLLGVEGVELDKGEMLVAHHRRGRVVATERYSA